VTNPLFGENILMQSVPTAIAKGLDGAYYVGELTGFPFPQSEARIYRINPTNNQPEVYAEGFTGIVLIGALGTLLNLKRQRTNVVE